MIMLLLLLMSFISITKQMWLMLMRSSYIRVALNQFHSHIEQECHEVGEYCLEEGVKSELFNSLKKLNKY